MRRRRWKRPGVARELNPDVKIITRTHYVSAGMEAKSRGADSVIVAEQVVASELSKLAEQILAPTHRRKRQTFGVILAPACRHGGHAFPAPMKSSSLSWSR
jgi:hypothetical protein